MPRWLLDQWNLGQYHITRLRRSPDKDPFRYPVWKVKRIIPVDGLFLCGELPAVGCTDEDGVISYDVNHPEVLSHEAGHYILMKMGDKRWPLFEHQEWCKLYDWDYWCKEEP